ncbi:MAG: hypothetical protein KatS3mg061_2416 [Dehalococcoidia bacterium]|nr:MAG: hypothetical protein KatS3mg061_2416 [Dehalococcoidia bacterium]
MPAAPAPPDRETPRPTPRLNVIVNNLINNPTPQSSTSNAWLYWPVWDSLVQFGPDYQVRPSVAERWQLSADSRTWTFTLRRDLTWPDGTPLTAADAAFTVSYIQQNNWPQRSALLSVERAEAPDPATLVLTTRQPDMSILNNLPTIWLLPQHYLDQVGFQGYVAKPMGSGPYEIVEFRAGDSLLLRKRSTPHAFRTVFIDELAFKVVTENSQKIRGPPDRRVRSDGPAQPDGRAGRAGQATWLHRPFLPHRDVRDRDPPGTQPGSQHPPDR